MLYKVTPCPAPEIWEVDGLRYLDQPRYVMVGRIKRDASGHETAEFHWEKHDAMLPVI